MTKPKRYKRFSSEFKREAILRAIEEGMRDKAVCDELGESTRQSRRWRNELTLLSQADLQQGFAYSYENRQRSLTPRHLL